MYFCNESNRIQIIDMEIAEKKCNYGANIRRWREWRNMKQDVLADHIGVSQSALSGYEKKEKLEPEIVEKIAKALEIPVEAITGLNSESPINIFSGTWNDSAVAQNFQPTFNPIDKIVELYEKLLTAEQEKVALLQEALKSKK